ncbi:hypothetical protein AURDEDRAFT_166539 [Auricularia subglabra TFB-10046 SS5]|nr:hypothetical protein AURDEDRAFT_166539 [Auricularia subglabra TFB-10046 SS5]
MQFTSFALAAVLAAVPAQAFIAWSGDHCDGPQGNNVNLDGSCRSFGGRHSFNAGSESCIKFYELGNCSGQRFTYENQGDRCTNVNTGTDIAAFRAWPGAYGCAPY